VESKLNAFNNLGDALRILRGKVAGLTQQDVAERTGIAQARLSRYEKGRKIPDLATLDRLLVCYGVDVERFGRALKESRGMAVPPDSGDDPEFTARVQDALLRLGYPSPGAPTPETAPL
jgi:transcriptional regulator with XRE-family HTH domain